MGTEPWYVIEKWEQDLTPVLARAQSRALSTGEYGPSYSRGEPTNATIDEVREFYEQVDTISESVLDVRAIADEPGVCEAGPFSDEVLEEMLGSTTPSRETAIAQLSELWSCLASGQAAYVVLYRDGEPDEVLFVGH